MRAIYAVLLLALAFCVQAQEEPRYTPVQAAHSGWYSDPEIANQGFTLLVNDSEAGRGLNAIWFIGDSNGDGRGEWYYSTATPDRFANRYPVYRVEGSQFPSTGSVPSLVPDGEARMFPIDCNSFLVLLTVNGAEEAFSARAITKNQPGLACYTCPAVDFAPLPEQCRY